jgi:beta-lactamase regulating signal transducer with metallopeptidase domain
MIADGIAQAGPWVAWLAGRLLTASVQGAIAVALVGLLCWRVRSIPAAARATLWWLVSLKFILALLALPSVPVPVLPPDEPVSIRQAVSVVAAIDSTQAATTPARHALDSSAVPDVPREPAWLFVVMGLWVAGVMAHALRLAATARRLRRVLRESVPIDAGEVAAVRRIAEDIGLRTVPEVRVSDDVDTPQVVRARRAVVLLPASAVGMLTQGERAMAIAHELMHVRRRDLLLGWVPACAERVFFFHPLARLAASEYVIAREAACDAAVVQALGVAPRDYGRVLMLLGISGTDPGLSAAVSARTVSSLSRRLDMLQHSAPSPRRTAWLMAAGLIALAMTPIHLVARPAEDVGREPQRSNVAANTVAPGLPSRVSGACEVSGASRQDAAWNCQLTGSFEAEGSWFEGELNISMPEATSSGVSERGERPSEASSAQASDQSAETTQEDASRALAEALLRRALEAELSAQRASQDGLALRSEELRRALEAVRAIAAETNEQSSRALKAAADEESLKLQQQVAQSRLREAERGLQQLREDEDLKRLAAQLEMLVASVRQQVAAVTKAAEESASKIEQLRRAGETVDRQMQEVLKQQAALLEERRRLAVEADRIREAVERIQREAGKSAK